MAVIEPIRIAGLREFQAGLKAIDGEAQKELRVALNDAAQIVVNVAKPKIPRRSGRAAESLKVSSSQREARVKGGSAKVPYYGWLDFGGRVGHGRTGKGEGATHRPFYSDGRYVYPAYYSQQDNITKLLAKRLRQLAEKHGMTVEGE